MCGNDLLAPERGVEESGHLVVQPRTAFAAVLVPAGLATALLAHRLDHQFDVVFIGGVVGFFDDGHVLVVHLLDDGRGFGSHFGIGSGIHHLFRSTKK